MKSVRTTLLLLSCAALASCNTVHKYATGRYYEIYAAPDLHACDYKPKFNDCAEQDSFDVKISDDNNRLALANYISPSQSASYFGFTRDKFSEQTQPIRDFIAWAKAGEAGSRHVTVQRKAGNAVGYLFENTDVIYVFDFLRTRGDVPILVLSIEGRGGHYGFTPQQAARLLEVIDAWYAGSFSGKKLTH